MTLQQLRYIVAIAEAGTFSGAAKALFITQPSLTKMVRELEREMGIQIFERTNKGVHLSRDGEIFLGYARQVLEQADLLESRYKKQAGGKQEFTVSTQHYSFAVNAFVDLIRERGGDRYDFSLRETQTYEIIEDVAQRKSEIGLLYLNDFNRTALQKLLRGADLDFTPLFTAHAHVFLSSDHPLSGARAVSFDDLASYPYLSFEQGDHNSFYFSEEIFSPAVRSKNIRVRDRATLFNLLIGLQGYTVCSGVIDSKLNGENIVAVPLTGVAPMEIGYILPAGVQPGSLCRAYIENLKQYVPID